jgi:hypothetical protein
MWHLIFGFIFSLVSFVGSLAFALGYAELQPIYEVTTIAIASLTCALLVILSTRGTVWASTILRFLALAPILIIGLRVSHGEKFDTFLLVLITFGITSFFLLSAASCRALVNVLAIRRAKVSQMKKDGTYKQKLEDARKRWR